MIDLSFAELAVVAVVALLIVGPNELPQALRSLMRGLSQIRRLTDELRHTARGLAEEAGLDDLQGQMETQKRFIRDQYGELQEVYDISELKREYPDLRGDYRALPEAPPKDDTPHAG